MKYQRLEMLPELIPSLADSVVCSGEPVVVPAGAGSVGETVVAFRIALQSAFGRLAGQGARPVELYQMTLSLPDVGLFDSNLIEFDLAFREALAGNFPEISVAEERGSAGPAVVLSARLNPPDPSLPVYDTFSQSEIDYQYSPRQQTENPESYFEHWRAAGPAYQGNRAAEVWFGDTPGQSYDLFLPDGAQDAPLHMFIHGGYWQALDKRNHAHMAAALLDAGIAVAMVNYDLMPGVDLTEIVRQARAAVAKAYISAGDYGYDAGRITVSGHSAGGHLTGVLVCTDWPAFDAALPADLIKGAVPISGLFDLQPLAKTGMNRVFRFSDEDIATLSPIHMIPGPAMPVLVSVGGDESGEFHRQSALFTDHLRTHGYTVRDVAMPGHNHFSIVEALTDKDAPLTANLIDMISAV